MAISTPVVLVVFNRPSKTLKMLEVFRRVRPEKLFVIADGPRNAEEALKCNEVRRIIDEGVDWPCEVYKNYADKNIGVKYRIPTGLDWVFSQVEEAIIFEDDCLPDPSFFPFCQELLEKYRDDKRVMHISGTNFAVRDKNFSCPDSYYFSQIGLIQGWATWKRAWKLYDVEINEWPKIKNSETLKKALGSNERVDYYNYLFDQYYEGRIKCWDSQWFLTRWAHGGLSIVPSSNLISNIGFDDEGFHKLSNDDARAHVPIKAMTFPLRHPSGMEVNKRADDYVFHHVIRINYYLKHKIMWLMRSRTPDLYALLRSVGRFFKKNK